MIMPKPETITSAVTPAFDLVKGGMSDTARKPARQDEADQEEDEAPSDREKVLRIKRLITLQANYLEKKSQSYSARKKAYYHYWLGGAHSLAWARRKIEEYFPKGQAEART